MIMPWARWAHLGTTVYLIWSNEHRAWWKSSSAGYSTDIREAGTYGFAEAERIVSDANRHVSGTEFPHEVMIQVIYPLSDDPE